MLQNYSIHLLSKIFYALTPILCNAKLIRKYVERSTYMTWKTVNLHLMKGSILAVYGDSALFFRTAQG